MQDYFQRCLQFVLDREGGYVNDPKDPGGETNFGISKRSYPDLDIKHITTPQVSNIYYQDFWLKNHCDKLSWPLCLCVFDTAVNMGGLRAGSFLKMTADPLEYLNIRAKFYNKLAAIKSSNSRFLKGWLNPITDLKREAGL